MLLSQCFHHIKIHPLQLFHWLNRRGQQLLLAKVKNADWQDWYILAVKFGFVSDEILILLNHHLDLDEKTQR